MQILKKIRVAVLMGGKSIEREVSFNSGRTICDHLDVNHYNPIPLFQRHDGALFILPWRFLHRGKISDFEHKLNHEAEAITWQQLKDRIDFIYIATHGRFAEDGTLQGMLEVLKIPYLGSKLAASALRIDKDMHKRILRNHGIDVPRWITIQAKLIHTNTLAESSLAQLLKKNGINFPCIVKPRAEGSSLGVTLVESENKLLDAIKRSSSTDPRRQQDVLIEEFLNGMEFTCIVLTHAETGELFALPPTEIVPESDRKILDYEQKYMPGRATKITPARITPEQTKLIQETAIKSMRTLGLTTMARIDGFLMPDNRVTIIDPNSLSGTDPASFLFRQAAEIGMSHTEVINHLIKTELKAYGMELIGGEQMHAAENKQRLRVGVIMGGASNEKEISLESGRNVVYKLSPHAYQAIPLFLSPQLELFQITQELLVRHSTQEILDGLTPEMKISWDNLKNIIDFAFLALHGGEGENGTLQGALEMLDIPYNGSGPLTSSLCMDKFKTAQFLKNEGFCVPNGELITIDTWKNNKNSALLHAETIIGFPCIIKPHDDGCSVLVFKAETSEQLSDACEKIFQAGKTGALIEERISGMELTVGVIGNQTAYAFPPSQAVAAGEILSIEEKFLPGAGENQTPAPIEAEESLFVRETMEKAYKILGCKGYVRIDCFFQKAEISKTKRPRVIILEVNNLPALTPATCLFHQAAEIGFRAMDLIDLIIQLGLSAHCANYAIPERYNHLFLNGEKLKSRLGEFEKSPMGYCQINNAQ